MLEVLVALLVLSVGLLGLATLQGLGLKFNTQSYQRTQAVMLAYDMIDRIRANPVGRIGTYYDTVTAGYMPSSPPNCDTGGCDPNQMATYDIYRWKTIIARQLANGTGAITTDAASGLRTLTLTWVENDLTQSLVVEARL